MAKPGEATAVRTRSVSGVAAGGVVLVSSVLAAGTLATRDTPAGPGSNLGGTLYSPASWMLLAIVVVAGLALLADRLLGAQVVRVATAVGLVAAVQLCGTGVVAFKHWRAYVGMQGFGDHLGELKALAAVLAVASLVAAFVLLWQLWDRQAVTVATPSRSRTMAILVGMAILILLPFAVGFGDQQTMDRTSLGAYALIYSAPWGLIIFVSGWLVRDAAVGALSTVLASLGLALIGPQMASLVFTNPAPAFLVTLAATFVVLLVRLRDRGPAPSLVG